MPQNPAEKIDEAEKKYVRRYIRIRLILVTLSVVLAAVAWFLFTGPLGKPAEERMDLLCSRAHSFAMVAEQWESRGNELESGIWQVKDEEGFPAYLLYYFEDSQNDWFGLALDADGEIAYTLYSTQEIPEDALQKPPVRDEQISLLSSHFQFNRRKAVGIWYADESLNPTEPAETTEATE